MGNINIKPFVRVLGDVEWAGLSRCTGRLGARSYRILEHFLRGRSLLDVRWGEGPAEIMVTL